MQIKEIEDWAKPIVDTEVDSEMYSRLTGKCQSGMTLEALQEELSASYYFPDAVYVESLLAAAYFFWHHGHHAHPIFYNCKRMIESGIPLVAMRELAADKTYLAHFAANIRLFYSKVLAESYGDMEENCAFEVLERAYCG